MTNDSSRTDVQKIKNKFDFNKQEIISSFDSSGKNTGSTEVQIMLLTSKIFYLTEHCKFNKKDQVSKRSLLNFVSKRKKLLKFLKKSNFQSYFDLIKANNLKDNIN